MKDLITAIGLLFIEGLIIAINGSRIKNIVKFIEHTNKKLRLYGVFFLALGFLIVWYVKN